MTYAEFCKTKCRWCEKGDWPRKVTTFHPYATRIEHSKGVVCTAPPIESAFAKLSQERDSLLAQRQKDQQTIAELRGILAGDQMLAYKWMVAHDRLKAGKPYEFPTPTDLPDAIKRRDSALATLRQVRLDVEKAPHAKTCPRFKEDFNCGRSAIETCKYVVAPCVKHRPITLPCNCFKSRVLAGIDKALGPEQGSPDGETPQAKADLNLLAVPEPTQEETQ